MLWINERMITEYDGSRHKEYDIHITRGDSAWLELVPMQDGVPYEPTENDTISVQVRKKPIKSDLQTELLFSGELVVSDGVPMWHIIPSNTNRDCGVYFWDVQLTIGEEVSTFASGRFIIEQEVTQ